MDNFFASFQLIWTQPELIFSMSRLTATLHEVSASKNSLAGQELNARKDTSFMLEDHGGDHLVYIPNQMLEPHKLASHRGNDQESVAMARLTSGKSMNQMM